MRLQTSSLFDKLSIVIGNTISILHIYNIYSHIYCQVSPLNQKKIEVISNLDLDPVFSCFSAGKVQSVLLPVMPDVLHVLMK